MIIDIKSLSDVALLNLEEQAIGAMEFWFLPMIHDEIHQREERYAALAAHPVKIY